MCIVPRKRRESNNASVKKIRARKREEKEKTEKRMEDLRRENQEIAQRTAGHTQVLARLVYSVSNSEFG